MRVTASRPVIAPAKMSLWTGGSALIAGVATHSGTVAAAVVTVAEMLGWISVLVMTWALPPRKHLTKSRMLWDGIAALSRWVRAALAFGITAVYGAAVALRLNNILGAHSTANSQTASRAICDAMFQPTEFIRIALAVLTPGWLIIAMHRTPAHAREDAATESARELYEVAAEALYEIMMRVPIFARTPWMHRGERPRLPKVQRALAPPRLRIRKAKNARVAERRDGASSSPVQELQLGFRVRPR